MLLQADTPPRATRTYVYRDSNEQIFNILLVGPACASPQTFMKVSMYCTPFKTPWMSASKPHYICMLERH